MTDDVCDMALASMDSAARIEALEGALKPFADLMDLVIGSAEENDFGVTATIQLTDLRRAARALKTIKPRI